MGEPGRAGGRPEPLEPSGVSQPSGVWEPSGVLGVPEPSRDPDPPGVPEPSGVPKPSGVPGVSQPSRGPDLPGVPEPSGVPKPSGVPGVPEPSGVPKPSEPSGVPGVLQPTPPPEVLEGLLSQRFGPLPRPAPIARLRRGPAGGYEPTGDPAEALERRQAANAKERERIRNLNSGFSQLRALVPLVPRDRRPSKADTLRAAAQYIRLLRGVLRDCQELGAEQELGGTAGGHPEPGLAVPPVPLGTPPAWGTAEGGDGEWGGAERPGNLGNTPGIWGVQQLRDHLGDPLVVWGDRKLRGGHPRGPGLGEHRHKQGSLGITFSPKILQR
ncbi:factor in the germline alpha [Anomalospiza imberbis]|uniref:factor in the germline alpha n=1 Tax=Anomalospiza imberbis TaxID=187417 RepID=UPI00358F8CAF